MVLNRCLTSTHILFLTILNIFNYLDRYLINALLPVVSQEFSLNFTQGGQVVSAFVFGYVIFSPVFGYLGDRVHRPYLLFLGVALWVSASCATGLAAGFYALLAARVFVGVGEASYGTISPGYIKDFIADPIKLNKTLSFFYTAVPVGAALGYVVAGLLITTLSWQSIFLVASLPAVIIGVAILFYPEVPHRRVPKGTVISQVKEIIGNRFLVLIILGYALNTFSLTGIAAFVSSYGQSLGFTLTEINNYFGSILVVSGFAGTLIGARIAGIYGAKFSNPCIGMLKFVACISAVAVPVMAVTFTIQDKNIFLVLCALTQLLIFAGVAPINSIIVVTCPPSLVTLTQGLTILTINVLGTLIGPLMIGLAADNIGLSLALQISTVAMALCAAVWWSQARSE